MPHVFIFDPPRRAQESARPAPPAPDRAQAVDLTGLLLSERAEPVARTHLRGLVERASGSASTPPRVAVAPASPALPSLH